MKKNSNTIKERSVNNTGLSFFRFWNFIQLIGLIIAPIFFILLPQNYFTNKDSICLSIVFFDLECYGCGMTRALKALVSFNVSEAIEWNKLSIVVFPLLSYYWLTLLVSAFKSVRK